ncbi:hypothetical protein [Sanguibacter sp. Leaf3]|uniref:hypothetical protein n=1 Tax=Sanguibacter sp. Leaf3 TaxID=1736209 RepID=UPI0012E335C2|nr:hypothetical protein [Sanguibacter sp. Leaf3]
MLDPLACSERPEVALGDVGTEAEDRWTADEPDVSGAAFAAGGRHEALTELQDVNRSLRLW